MTTDPPPFPPAPSTTASNPKRLDFDAQDQAVTADLKRRTARGGLYTVVSQLASVLLQTGSVAVLGRLLTPDDFGLITLVSSLTGFMLLFREMGLPTATVQAKRLTHDQVNTVFWINLGMGAVLATMTVALAPAAAWFFDDPRIAPVMWVMAGLFVVGGLTVQHKALLRRTLRIGVVQGLQVAGKSAGIVAAILLAVAGATYWALVLGQVVSAAVMLVGCWVASGWRPSRPAWGKGSGAMLKYGGELTASNLLAYGSKNIDNILIGKVWGSASLGVYSKAYGLLLLPVQQFTRPMAGVVIPGLSRLQQEPTRFAAYLYRAVHLMAFAALPAVALLAWYADEVIRVVLGPQWSDAGPLFRVLAIAALCQPIAAGCTWLFLSSGRTASMLRLSVLQTAVVVSGFAATVAWGPWWMAASFAAANILLLWPQMHSASRDTPVTVGGMIRSVRGPAVGTLLMTAILGLWPSLIPDTLNTWWTTGLGVAFAIVTYLGFTALSGDLKQASAVVSMFRNPLRPATDLMPGATSPLTPVQAPLPTP